jgi:hypothetical protein
LVQGRASALQCILRSSHRLIDALRTRIGNLAVGLVTGRPTHIDIVATFIPHVIDELAVDAGATARAHSGRVEITRGMHRSLLLHRGFIVTPLL